MKCRQAASGLKQTERFTGREKHYQAARPAYAPAAVEFLLSAEGLGRARVIADIGSGTGILSAQLLEARSVADLVRVYGVEPNASMRKNAETALAEESRFRSIDGTGEATGLKEASVDAITVAQAFHWFDFLRARAEFRRIAGRGARVAVLWNFRDEDRDALHRAYEKYLRQWAPGYAEVHSTWAVAKRMGPLFSEGYRLRRFEVVQPLTIEGLRSRLLSSSYSPVPEDAEFPAAMETLNGLFDRHSGGSAKEKTVEMVYACECHVGTL